MTTARKRLVSIDSTPYYHCVSRCVRRGFLCGVDPYTQQNYEHRRAWIEQKIQSLSTLYCVDICAYAIMSNHYHLVVHLNRDKAQSLSLHQIVERWSKQHKLPTLVGRWVMGQLTCAAEEKACLAIIESWRHRLWSLSWFMKELNYDIAVRANEEDACKGHVWECRFSSQALLDQQALTAAMVYVDLNPVRAGIAPTIETSKYTSIKARLLALKKNKDTAPFLFPFINNKIAKLSDGIPLKLLDYVELVDWTAKHCRDNKANTNPSLPSVLQRLNITPTTWNKASTELERYRATAIGCQYHIETAKRHMRKTRIRLFRLDS